ncbi:hypothetical protein ABZ707_04760 [Streptomyces sp. NPDC006923]|uniref:hypothetical protein n=1 Tax=Streptomyces sp. NPDC006923 TaxID=3155355 RepID=UPI0033DEF6AD
MRNRTRVRLASLITSLAVVAGGGAAHAEGAAGRSLPTAPTTVDGGAWRSGHLQGMAVDRRKGHMYFSFTDLLVKTDLRGKPIGSVTGVPGHLGDLDFNEQDGRVYGSLEHKAAKAFYVAIFNGARITRMNMPAESAGVVSAVHLKEVGKDYSADVNRDGVFDGDTANTPDHRYGCSGIDGVAFGPSFDRKGGQKLTVAYGTYANATRRDNDHQVLLQYDVRQWKKYERPLSRNTAHRSGPASPDGKYFAYTGNTTYGVQNLEYDAHSRNWLLAVYRGTKTQFPNYSLFVLDGSKRPVRGVIRGQGRSERGSLLPLLPRGLNDKATGLYGWQSGGQYGLISLDDGRFYVARTGTAQQGGTTRQSGRAVLHRWTGLTPNPFAQVSAASAGRKP